MIDGLTLTINPGSTALLGPNGAGKTTLLEAIVTLRPPHAGGLSVFGRDVGDIQNIAEIRRLTGFLPQTFCAVKGFMVRDLISYAAWTKGVPSPLIEERVATALELVQLVDRRSSRVGSLSGGMLQRAGIACALVHQPKLLVLDEPTVGLDPQQRAHFRDIIRGLSDVVSVLLSTHITDDVEACCDSVVILAGGSTLFHASTAELALFGRARTEQQVGGVSNLERGYLGVLVNAQTRESL